MYRHYGAIILKKIMNKLFESIEFDKIDLLVIIKVRELRVARGWSARDLSEKMGFYNSFVGKVESMSDPTKYNMNHIYILLHIFNIKKYEELLPSLPFNNEKVKVLYYKVPVIKSDGTVGKKIEAKIERIVPVG